MNKKISLIINIVLIVIFLTGVGLFIIQSNNISSSKTLDTVSTVVSKDTTRILTPPSASPTNWEGLATALISLLSFGFKSYYEYKQKSKESQHLEYNNSQHPVFDIIDELQLNDLRNLNLGTIGRTMIFRDILTIQIGAYETALREFITSKFSDGTDFRVRARRLFLKIVEDYEKRWATFGIPTLVIDRYKCLQESRIKLLLSDVETLTFYRLSDNTTDFNEVVFYLLTHASIILRLAVSSDSLEALKALNGSLKEVVYNGHNL